jgi:hypothetical protein
VLLSPRSFEGIIDPRNAEGKSRRPVKEANTKGGNGTSALRDQVVLWHGAERTFGESFGFDGEGAVETGTGIFPGNDGGEFDELALGKLCAQGGVKFVRHTGRCVRQRCGEAQYDFFLLVEMGTGFKLSNVLKLLLSDSIVFCPRQSECRFKMGSPP